MIITGIDMSRLDNWQCNLSELIESKRHEAFKFGTFDCSLWAMLAIEAVNSVNLYSRYIGKYKSAKGALRKLTTVDQVAKPIELFEKYLGEQRSISFARQGDIVFTSDPEAMGIAGDLETFGPVPGVCYGPISFFVGESGLVDISTFKMDSCLWVS